MAKNSPSFTSNDTPFSAVIGPKRLVMPSSLIVATAST